MDLGLRMGASGNQGPGGYSKFRASKGTLIEGSSHLGHEDRALQPQLRGCGRQIGSKTQQTRAPLRPYCTLQQPSHRDDMRSSLTPVSLCVG